MKKIILILMILTVAGFMQQLKHTQGTNLGGTEYTAGLGTYIDTTAATTNYFYVDLDDFYWMDIFPMATTGTVTGFSSDTVGLDSISGATTVAHSSNLFYIGTFYVSFDNQGAAPTADSLGGYSITATPGFYTTASKSLAAADFGTAIELEEVREVNDYFTINNVYLHATKYKLFPPQIVRLGISPPATNSGMDDSTMVYWDFVYPQIYNVHGAQK